MSAPYEPPPQAYLAYTDQGEPCYLCPQCADRREDAPIMDDTREDTPTRCGHCDQLIPGIGLTSDGVTTALMNIADEQEWCGLDPWDLTLTYFKTWPIHTFKASVNYYRRADTGNPNKDSR